MQHTSPELAGGVNLARLLVKNGTDALAADLQDAVVLLRGGDHGEAVVNRVGERLLAIDVFARGAGVHHDPAMLVVGDGDDDGVHVFAIEDLFVVARCGNLSSSAVSWAAVRRPSQRSQTATHSTPGTRSDAFSNSQPRTPVPIEAKRTVLPARCLRGGGQHSGGFKQGHFRSGTGGQSARSDAHELTAIPGIISQLCHLANLRIGEIE